MFGINLLNPFSGGRFVQTTTIIWLQLFVAALIIGGAVLSYYYSREVSGSGLALRGLSYLLMVLGLILIIIYFSIEFEDENSSVHYKS